MKKFQIFLISFLVYLQSVVFAEDEKANEIVEAEWVHSVSPEYRSLIENEKTTEEPVDMMDTFDTNLEEIQKFARNVKPITSDIRLSMHSRRSFNEDHFFNVMKMTAIKLLNAAEKYAPSAKFALQVPRALVKTMLTK